MTEPRVAVMRLPHGMDLPLPAYATEGSAGMDLLAAVGADVVLQPGERKLVPSGIAISIPPGVDAQVRPRSGLASFGPHWRSRSWPLPSAPSHRRG